MNATTIDHHLKANRIAHYYMRAIQAAEAAGKTRPAFDLAIYGRYFSEQTADRIAEQYLVDMQLITLERLYPLPTRQVVNALITTLASKECAKVCIEKDGLQAAKEQRVIDRFVNQIKNNDFENLDEIAHHMVLRSETNPLFDALCAYITRKMVGVLPHTAIIILHPNHS